VGVRALRAHTAAAYLKFGLLERPSVGVAVAVTALPHQVYEVRVAVGCVGPTPRRLRDVEGLLSQKELSEVRATYDVA
jgi:CO/xanthine dehydrogenase FAD-binding subunit